MARQYSFWTYIASSRSQPAARSPRLADSPLGVPDSGGHAALQSVRMVSGLLIVLAAALVTAVVSRFMWWACRRSAAWSMVAGVILAVLAVGGAVVIAWLLTRAWYGT